jgi:3-oxoacyl-[acyl-carrier protein] reductase
MNDLAGQKVIITGAGGLFGGGIAKRLAESGAHLCLSDVRGDCLKDLCRELPDTDRPHLVHETELQSEASIADLMLLVKNEWGAPDVLINNAGVYPSGRLLDIDTDEWDRIQSVNVRAPYILTRDTARLMIGQGVTGNIINVSSPAARSMRVSVVPYCISKSALDRLALGFGLELSQYGIRVNTISPGFARGSTVTAVGDNHANATIARTPLKRAVTMDDLVNGIVFLCSKDSDFVTGATLNIDGGMSMGSLVDYTE